MTTLYISDMDGTLLSTDSRVSSNSATILSQLNREGALFTVATARTPATVHPLLRDTATIPHAVVMTGAALWDRQHLAYVDTKFIDISTCRYIADTIHRYGINPFIYTLNDTAIIQSYHNGPLTESDKKFIDDRRDLQLKQFHIGDPIAASGVLPNTMLFFAMSGAKKIFPAAEEIQANTIYPTSVSAYVDIWGEDNCIIEIKAPGTSKADSVAALKKRYNADRLVVFGDNLNDLSMMAISDVAVAVDNAVDQVKEKADIIIGPNYDDSVARFVRDDFHANR